MKSDSIYCVFFLVFNKIIVCQDTLSLDACFSICNYTSYDTNLTKQINVYYNIEFNCTKSLNCLSCCTVSKPIDFNKSFTVQKHPQNLFSHFNPKLINILNIIYPNYNLTQISSLVSRKNELIESLKKFDFSRNCKAGDLFYQYIEDELISNSTNNQLINFEVLTKVIACKQDCNFKRLLSVKNSVFTSISENQFFKIVIKYLPPNAKLLCQSVFKTFLNISDFLDDSGDVSFLNFDQLNKLTSNESLMIAKSLNNKIDEKISQLIIKLIGINIPDIIDATEIPSIASSIPLKCFTNSDPHKIAESLNLMDLENMNSFRKVFLAYKVGLSKNLVSIVTLLNETSDTNIINSIPISVISNLNISLSESLSVNQLPLAYLKNYAMIQLKNRTLANFTNLDTISKLLPGMTTTDILNIPICLRVTTIVNILNASLSYHVPLTNIQRLALLNSLIESLKVITDSTNAKIYLSNLTIIQLEILYPLFIEASSSILSAFTHLNSFLIVISKVASISSSNCCDYSRKSRQRFASFAIPIKFAYTNLGFDDLITLGPCIVSVLPTNYLKNITSEVFIKYFPRLGNSFQPDDSQIQIIQSFISQLASKSSSQDTLVFSTLSDLALFYNFSSPFAKYLTDWKTSGTSLMNKINRARNPNEESNQLCQLGLTNSVSIQSLINNYGYNLISNHKSIVRRAKRNRFQFTCTQLNSLSGSLNQLSIDDLAQIDPNEFYSCQCLLGLASNSWSTAQLVQLAKKAKSFYVSINNISDSNIVRLSTIIAGFVPSDLEILNFTTIESISTLGSVNDWNSDQIVSLNIPLTNYVQNYMNGTITSSFITVVGNLACSFDSLQIASLNKTNFNLIVGSLSKISINCPNMIYWYSLAKNSSDYGVFLYSSTSALTELGSIITGISDSDLKNVRTDYISSITEKAFKYMSASKVNHLSFDQISNLTMNQLVSLLNSPNYPSFTARVKVQLHSIFDSESTSNYVFSMSRICQVSSNLLIFLVSSQILLFIF